MKLLQAMTSCIGVFFPCVCSIYTLLTETLSQILYVYVLRNSRIHPDLDEWLGDEWQFRLCLNVILIFVCFCWSVCLFSVVSCQKVEDDNGNPKEPNRAAYVLLHILYVIIVLSSSLWTSLVCLAIYYYEQIFCYLLLAYSPFNQRFRITGTM